MASARNDSMLPMHDEMLDISENEFESNSSRMASCSAEMQASLPYHCPSNFGLNF